MESIFDLPAHPMFVHAPLVLMPLLTLAAVAVALRPPWRQSFGPLLVAASAGLVLVTVLATQSGKGFNKLLLDQGTEVPIDTHRSLAQTTQWFVVVFCVLLVATVGLAWYSSGRRGSHLSASGEPLRMLGHGLAVLATLFGLLGSIWMFRTGHEGAKVVWEGTVPTAEAAEN